MKVEMGRMLCRYRILCFLIFALCCLVPQFSADMRLQPMKVGYDDCIDDEFKAHPVGSRWYSKKKCEEHSCLFIKGILYVMQSGCGKVGYSPECKLVQGNKDSHYPDCCPQVECPEVEYDYYYMR
uniref:U2-Theraphotoxin-Sfo1a_1 n=1 Tax=Selenotholus foelschei TaxID=1905327 RepID=A0A482ZI90_9ARAC